MTAPVETVRDPKNTMKWVVAIALIAAAALVNRMLPEMSLVLRGLLMTALGVAALVLAALTLQGKSFIDLLQQAQVELRKVVWPTRQETSQTTLIVLVVVVIMSLLLWGMDSLFGFAISAVIG
ncbi:preprotein translocase subunit SecE [Perlucidibaca aquatica]|jgi:preprotein translocase subunit SecE|uniref:preprotein translocase subunit SecE n=1 Tax=Perlucidibaca aquatica TaxID=1852776 RepID=UPI00083A681B|nr:preprotein translocase subunit SecE [Perlucidibaca aquatica]